MGKIIENYIREKVKEGKKYWIYGSGYIGNYLAKTIQAYLGEQAVEGFVESKPTSVQKNNIKIIEIDNLESLSENDIYVVGSQRYHDVFVNNLKQKGVKEENIITIQEIFSYLTPLQEDAEQISSVLLWPPLECDNTDLYEKINWFAPDRIKFFLHRDENVKLDFNDNVEEYSLEKEIDICYQVDAIFVYDMDKLNEYINQFKDKLYIVDPRFFDAIETMNWSVLYYLSFSKEERKQYHNKSVETYKNIKEEAKKYKKSNVFCSGPSICELNTEAYCEEFNIICNSMVKDDEYMKLIRPNILCFADINYYFSPTLYGKKFFSDVVKRYKEYNYYLVVWTRMMPLLLWHFPMFENKVVGMRFSKDKYQMCNEENLCALNGANILTAIMLPIASGLFDEIGIFGATGRSQTIDYFWNHNDRTQYKDLIHTVFEMYPSWIEARDYEDYYDRHCEFLRGFIEYGEKQGKKYKNYTTSFIPALKERTVEI